MGAGSAVFCRPRHPPRRRRTHGTQARRRRAPRLQADAFRAGAKEACLPALKENITPSEAETSAILRIGKARNKPARRRAVRSKLRQREIEDLALEQSAAPKAAATANRGKPALCSFGLGLEGRARRHSKSRACARRSRFRGATGKLRAPPLPAHRFKTR